MSYVLLMAITLVSAETPIPPGVVRLYVVDSAGHPIKTANIRITDRDGTPHSYSATEGYYDLLLNNGRVKITVDDPSNKSLGREEDYIPKEKTKTFMLPEEFAVHPTPEIGKGYRVVCDTCNGPVVFKELCETCDCKKSYEICKPICESREGIVTSSCRNDGSFPCRTIQFPVSRYYSNQRYLPPWQQPPPEYYRCP